MQNFKYLFLRLLIISDFHIFNMCTIINLSMLPNNEKDHKTLRQSIFNAISTE